jgi:Fe-S-cluster-containing hydrogenase component 2
VSKLYCPLYSLEEGNWFKLICGASFQHLPSVRSLALAYTLAGADCIDVAADRAVITAAKEAIEVAKTLADAATLRGYEWQGKPWLMVSLNDDEDPHFRKAEFDSKYCPSDCPRPCEKVCPAQAIVFSPSDNPHQELLGAIAPDRCYGCGRCLPVCPSQIIYTRSHISKKETIGPLIQEMEIDAIEIHTSVGHEKAFEELWEGAIAPLAHKLKILAISCQDGPDLIEYLHFLSVKISPLPCPLIWQTDGRPMSGDIGNGTTRAAIKLAEKVLAQQLPGYIQLAGGTNYHTVNKLKMAGLLKTSKVIGKEWQNLKSRVSGIAYGSYARSLLLPILEVLESENYQKIEDCPELLWQAVNAAHELVAQLKLKTKNAIVN